MDEQKFQEELCWCIDHLESNLQSKKLSEKQIKDISKTISSLKNKKNPLAKKRQLMRVSCGDYREKMAKDDQKFKMNTQVTAKVKKHEKSLFLKRHHNSDPVQSCESAFKFNFKISDQETKEDPVQVEKFKFVKSNNTFRFNFSANQ